MARLHWVVGSNPVWNSYLYPFYLDVNYRKIKTNSCCEVFVKTFILIIIYTKYYFIMKDKIELYISL